MEVKGGFFTSKGIQETEWAAEMVLNMVTRE
jgi:hypothetical protein